MDDTILLNMSQASFENLVGEAFKWYRDGNLLALSTSSLVPSGLVAPCFLDGEPVTLDAQGRALQSLLRWTVDKLRPAGVHNWLLPAWRHYNLLRYYYLQGFRAAELAELIAISEQTLYQVRVQAVAAAARILHEELATPRDAQGRKNYALADRYARQSADEQTILRIATLTRRPLPATLLYELFGQGNDERVQAGLSNLVAAGLLTAHERGTVLAVHPELRRYILTLLSPDERRAWHQAAGLYFNGQRDYLESAYHYRLAGEMTAAARLLVSHHQQIIDRLQIEDLRGLLAEFTPAEVADDLWAQLKIVSGDVAKFVDDVDTALEEYQKALAARDLHSKALAYYRRAEVYKLKNLDESLAHYDYCIKLLEDAHQLEPLLTKVYIDRAWLFIQERQDLERAEASLRRAQEIIGRDDHDNRPALYNAWAGLWYRRGDLEKTMEFRWQAWLVANEVQDVDQMINTAHNLGLVYVERGRYDQGLVYLSRSLELAVQAGYRKMEGLCNKSIGGCYFRLARVEEAIASYRRAHAIFVETGNPNWQSHVCCDLAEAFAEIGDLASAKVYFNEGLAIAQALRHEVLLEEWDHLARRHPSLSPRAASLNARQLEALAFLTREGKLSNQTYRELTGVSQKQAVRDLNELVDQGMLGRAGSGRSTHYVLVRGSGETPPAGDPPAAADSDNRP